jgi:hypothetical protein
MLKTKRSQSFLASRWRPLYRPDRAPVEVSRERLSRNGCDMNGLRRLRTLVACGAVIFSTPALPARAANVGIGGTFMGCPPQGKLHSFMEPSERALIAFLLIPGIDELNRKKNRATVPTDVSPLSVKALNSLKASRENLLGGASGATTGALQERRSHALALITHGAPRTYATNGAASGTYTAAVVRGYLAVDTVVSGARQSGPETPNCGGTAGRDFHIWLVDSRDQPRANAAVVEMTPRWQKTNPGWLVQRLQQIADAGKPVRATGWLLFDPEHPGEVGHTRGGQWEIHPVTKFEYYENSTWTEL